MALFKISKGSSNQLLTGSNSQYAREGSAWFTTDDGKFYIDIAGNGSTTKAVLPTSSGATAETINRVPLNAYRSDFAQVADELSSSLFIGSKEFDGSSEVTISASDLGIEAIAVSVIEALE